jgi:hypothetical protein
MKPKRIPSIPALIALVLAGMLAAPLACAAHLDAGNTGSRHFDLMNATFDSVTAIEVAPAGSDDFHAIALDRPLQGGLTAMTFDLTAGPCLRDLRLTFEGGRQLLLPRIDVCRTHGLRLGAKQ